MKKMDNKGLTLVELVIAVAIATMIMGAAAMFMYNAQRTYRIAEHTINLQMDAQIIMEQMSNWILESNRIYYETDTVNAANSNVILVLYYIPRDNGRDTTDLYPLSYSGGNKKASRRIIFCVNGKLYMKEENNIDNGLAQYQELLGGTSSSALYSSADVKDENCIGDYVYQFNVESEPSSTAMSDLTAVEISLFLKEGKQEYSATDSYGMRNGRFKEVVEHGVDESSESSEEGTDE